MSIYNVHDAKTHFSRLLDAVADGEDVVLARAGKPVARLVPYVADGDGLRYGALKGRVRIARDFDAPLPVGVLAGFEGG